MNERQGDVFLSMGAQTDTIKLAMAGTYLRLVPLLFSNCWVTDSIWLVRAEPLITKRQLSWWFIYSV